MTEKNKSSFLLIIGFASIALLLLGMYVSLRNDMLVFDVYFNNSISVANGTTLNDSIMYEGENVSLLFNDVGYLTNETAVNETDTLQTVTDRGSVTTNDIETTSDVILDDLYIGAKATVGSWRILQVGDNLEFQQYEGGTWVNKVTFPG